MSRSIFQTWPMLRRIRDRDVNKSGCDLIDQILRHVDVDAKGDIPKRAPHPEDPIEQKRLP
jgi:hypothetical protein